MNTDPYMAWLDAARRADALREELGDLIRAGKTPPAELLERLAKLEDEVRGLQQGVAAAARPLGPLH